MFDWYTTSHPTRVRGLKRTVFVAHATSSSVAPHAGAWIETFAAEFDDPPAMSHPTRVRGLKLQRVCLQRLRPASHPTRVRGLKPWVEFFPDFLPESHPTRVRGLKLVSKDRIVRNRPVAPHAGAWIETLYPA